VRFEPVIETAVGHGQLRYEGYALERDRAVQQLVLGTPDDTEAAGAETLEEAIATVQQRAIPNLPRMLARDR
jgi:hypothetical protein